MMVRSMERNNIKEKLTTFKLMEPNKKMLLTLEFHTPQLLSKWKHQLHMQRTIKLSHILMEVATTTQELHQWTQMVQFGKELSSTMERLTERNNIKKMLMIFKLMEQNKKMLLTLEFHMHLHFFKWKQLHQFQQKYLFQKRESHI